MNDYNSRIEGLQKQLEVLRKKQEAFSHEIHLLDHEIQHLKNNESAALREFMPMETAADGAPEVQEQFFSSPEIHSLGENLEEQPVVLTPKVKNSRTASSMEKFIGENLINKIGILITVIGVAIGAKYSIENDLISPLTRIILGYAAGISLLATGAKLKKNYLNYSAVLVSGAIAILYFITFFAYDFYNLIPNVPAFGLMFIFTVFTIIAALKYDKQIIAHLGLVGAYAIPLLLSDGSGKVHIMLTYMTIINVGILILSFKKYWKALLYSSFTLTWLFVIIWFFNSYDSKIHLNLAVVFITVFFAIFYLSFLSYKLLRKEKFDPSGSIIVLLNSFIFYGLGIALLDDVKNGGDLLGIFTLGNALLHFAVSALIYRQKLADKNLFYLIAGLVLVFITLAVPIQLNGNWVTLIWTAEAALLFWIGRAKKVVVYEKLSYLLMIIAFISLLQDWSYFYKDYYYGESMAVVPFVFNTMFLTSVLFLAGFGFIYYTASKNNAQNAFKTGSKYQFAVDVLLPAIIIGVAYFAVRLEIAQYWNQRYEFTKISSKDTVVYNEALLKFREMWLLNYTLLFFSILSFLNFYRIKNNNLAKVSRILLSLFVMVFLSLGLFTLSDLREIYLQPEKAKYFDQSFLMLGMRYISYAFLGLALFTLYQSGKIKFITPAYPKLYDCLLHVCILWIASSELIHWLDLSGYQDVYKLGITILWAVYAMLLIALGIWRKKQYFRIGGIALFGVTLIKLFFYDISLLGSGSKTILFVSLGVLLLIISFLYNKYKHLIFTDHDEDETDTTTSHENEA